MFYHINCFRVLTILTGTSLFLVAAQEIDHSIGLQNSNEKGAQEIQPNFVLSKEDRNGSKTNNKWLNIPNYQPVDPSTTTSTSTTTRRPYIHHHNRHPERPYRPYPRASTKYPVYYPDRPHYPDRSDPRYNYPNHRHPRPTETTTHPTIYRPRYPNVRPEYPRYNTSPNDPVRTTQRPETTTTPADKPDACDTSYDAVALIRNELFIFKNRYHWRIGASGRYPGYPMEITKMWSSLPNNLTHVDAVYERPDRKIAIFIGKQLYLFDALYLLPGYPKPLTVLGIPDSVEKLDAAMVWGLNGKTYFFSGSIYWQYNEDDGRVELDYPRNMAMWKGVGYNIDSVFQWRDGKTYFFKDKGFWQFNDLQMRVEHEEQRPSATFWMRCPDLLANP